MSNSITKKYRLLEDEYIHHKGRQLYRIESLIDFKRYDVFKGDLGGYIEKEQNLSHYGESWVFHDAKVYDNAVVAQNACITESAEIYGRATVSGNANVYCDAQVYGNAFVGGNAFLTDACKIYGNATVTGLAYITDDTEIYEDMEVCSGCLTKKKKEGLINDTYVPSHN